MKKPIQDWLLAGALAVALVQSTHAQEIQLRYSKAANQFSADLPKLTPIQSNVQVKGATCNPNERKACWGTFWLETGDGHYQLSNKPVIEHQYSRGKVPAEGLVSRMIMTPFYARSAPVELTLPLRPAQVSSENWTAPTRKYLGRGQVLGVETNSRREVIPGQAIRLAVTYKAPAFKITSGHLAILFNRKSETQGRLKPFVFNPASIASVHKLTDSDGNVVVNALGIHQNKVKQIFAENSQQLVYAIQTPMSANEERNFFFTLILDKRIDELPKEERREFEVTAIWIPQGMAFDPQKNLRKTTLVLAEIHDPNRIKLRPGTAYFRKKHQPRLDAKVQFQNNGLGLTNDVKVELDFNNPVKDLKMGQTVPECEPCRDRTMPDSVFCYTVDTTSGVNFEKANVTFHNIGLLGKKDFGLLESKKLTKGWFEFSAQPIAKRVATTRAKASIHFDQNEAVVTNPSTVAWRQRGLFLQAGYNLGAQAESFQAGAKNYLAGFNGGIGYLNAPVGGGWSRGLFLGATPLALARNNDFLINGQTFSNTQNLQMLWAEVRGSVGLQLNQYARVQFSGGVGAPVLGQMDVRSGELMREFPLSIFEQPKPQKGNPNNTDNYYQHPIYAIPPSAIGLGYSLQIGLEFGLVNDVTLGLNYDRRLLRGLSKGDCVTINTLGASLRVKLAGL
jgi:hypothetical protein